MRIISNASLSILAVVAGLSGCVVGPDFTRPAAPAAHAYSPQAMLNETSSAPVMAGESQRFSERATIPFDWWTLFQSAPLNALIERALEQNPDIESAQASLRQAQEYANAQRGYFYPTVGLSYNGTRNKLAGNSSSQAPGPQGNGDVIQETAPNSTYYNFHVSQLSVGFVPDVFGGNRRQMESAEALVSIEKFQLEAAHITLASNVFAAALQQAMLHAQISAMEKIVSANQEQLEILNKQFTRGNVSGVEVATQASALAVAKQALLPLQLQLLKNQNLMAALQGNFTDHATPESITLTELHLPQEIPLSLPSQLVEQRPDVRAAEEELHYASAQAGVAIANRLPQFSISAVVGGMANTPEWMFRTGGNFFNLSASISQVLFDGGIAHAKSRAAEQALIKAGAQYRSTVITAIQNVADTLYSLQSDAENLQAATDVEQTAATTLAITDKQYQLGAINYQMLLLAQQAHQTALISLIQAQASRFADTAALYQALGGGWWNRPDTTASFSKALSSAANP